MALDICGPYRFANSQKKSSRPGRNNKINVDCVGWHKRANHRSAQLCASLNGPAKKQKREGRTDHCPPVACLLGTQLARDRAIGFRPILPESGVSHLTSGCGILDSSVRCIFDCQTAHDSGEHHSSTC